MACCIYIDNRTGYALQREYIAAPLCLLYGVLAFAAEECLASLVHFYINIAVVNTLQYYLYIFIILYLVVVLRQSTIADVSSCQQLAKIL